MSTSRRTTANCAKIWNYIYDKGGDYKTYANDIDDICSADSLTDQNGLTVIIPDKKFMEYFHNNIHGEGSASVAKRVLMNTIIRKYLPDIDDFEALGTSIPFRSGLTMKLEYADPQKGKIIFSDNITITKSEDFNSPKGFKYAVWEVKSGSWPTETNYELKRKKIKSDKKTIKGGGNYIVNVGRALQNSDDARRVGLISSILMEYKTSLLRRQKREKVPDPLLLKCVSLYNWVQSYRKDIFKSILYITDIHPGVNLLLHILDPNSVIDDDILFGTGDKSDSIPICNGWRNSCITTNPHEEWKTYLEKASQWCEKPRDYNKFLLEVRNDCICKKKIEVGNITKNITKLYDNTLKYIGKYIKDSSISNVINERYSDPKFKGRKMWEDQLRYVGTSTFAGYDNMTVTAFPEEIIESLQATVSFRPISNNSYEKAATFTYEGGRFMSQEDYFLALKWVFSTDFMYMPSGIGSNSLALLPVNKKPYDGTINSRASCNAIINCDRISYNNIMSNTEMYHASPEIMYGINWTLKQQAQTDEQRGELNSMLNKLNMDGYKSEPEGGDIQIGGDPLLVRGGRLAKSRKKRRVIEEYSDSDSIEEPDDDLANLANLTFMVRPQGTNCLHEDESEVEE